MKKLRVIPYLALGLLLLTFGCDKESEGDKPPVTQLKIDGLVTVDFPAGSIKSSSATLDKVTSPQIQAVFDESTELFGATHSLPYQVVLNIGSLPPENDSITATFTLPSDLKSALQPGQGPALFAQVVQENELEVHDNFNVIPTRYDVAQGTLTTKLPNWLFADDRTSNQTYEAIFMLALTPGDHLNQHRPLRGADADGCKAGQLVCPVSSAAICTAPSSPYGIRNNPKKPKEKKKHWGVDFAVPVGTPVSAAESGVVQAVLPNHKDFGLMVSIKHVDGSSTNYAHLSSTSVKKGDPVTTGQNIGLSGDSGRSFGAHLHFEYVPNGAIFGAEGRIDPFPCISDGNGQGSITVRDDGSAADDAFALFLDNTPIGVTQIGQSNTVAPSNLRAGIKTLRLDCTIAPDNVGTYEISLHNGVVFRPSGDSLVSSTLPEHGTINYQIEIPVKMHGTLVTSLQPVELHRHHNAYRE